MNVELAALEAIGTWEVTPLPHHKKIVGFKWLYKIKYLPYGKTDRYKARLVAKGFTRTQNLDYFETVAPVVKMTSFQILLALAALSNWDITQLDVTNAFLHVTLDEEVYISRHPCYTISEHILQSTRIRSWCVVKSDLFMA